MRQLLYEKCLQYLSSPKKTVQNTVGIPCGGDGGNRTPVRKRFDSNFSGRRRLFTFPHPGANRHAQGLGSFIMHGALKALRTHVHHLSTPHPGPWSSRVGRSLLRQREEQDFRCSLIYKLAHFMDGRRIRPLFLPPHPRRNQCIPVYALRRRAAAQSIDGDRGCQAAFRSGAGGALLRRNERSLMLFPAPDSPRQRSPP